MVSAIRTFFLNRLARITGSGNYIPEIDGLRFVAILVVILFHLNGYLRAKTPVVFDDGPLTSLWIHFCENGGIGVKLFFVISGFILALPFASHYAHGTRRVKLGKYYLKRLTRLEPPYVASMLLFYGMLVVNKGVEVGKELLPSLWASLLYQHNLIFGTMSEINEVAWSLEVEVQFYVAVPLLVLVFRLPPLARRSLFLAVMALNGIPYLAALPDNPLHVLGYLQYFIAGFLLADLFLDGLPAKKTRWADLWAVAAVVWMLASTRDLRLLNLTLPVATFLFYYSVFRGHWVNRLFCNVYIRSIGGMCYSIYLLHYIIISVVGRVTTQFFQTKNYLLFYAIQGTLILSAILVISGTFFMLIERPCMDPRWPQKLWAWVRRRA